MFAADKVLTLYHGSKAGLEGPIGLKPGRNRTARDLVRRYAGKESGR